MIIIWTLVIITGVATLAKLHDLWIMNVTFTRHKFDGKGNIIRTNPRL